MCGGSGGRHAAPARPLPLTHRPHLPPPHPTHSQVQRSTLLQSTLNLTNVILGAGMYALPHAFAGLGLAGGSALVAAVGGVTYYSVCVLLRAAERERAYTYPGMVGRLWGRRGALVVRLFTVAGCGMFMVSTRGRWAGG